MEKKKLHSILHPVRIRILLCLSKRGEATTRQIAADCPDIPPATLYRHAAGLLREGTLAVARENRRGGLSERVYRVAENLIGEAEEVSGPEELLGMFYQFLLSTAGDFDAYLNTPGADPRADGMGFRYSLLQLNDEEFAAFTREWQKLVRKYERIGPGPERRLRKLSTLLCPIQPDGGEDN